ncbi:MAG TPA: CsgG/HfaB family protein [Usitatibacter sp.]|nr:CsgG/HfaB family protein [Usitatibacter sp.]
MNTRACTRALAAAAFALACAGALAADPTLAGPKRTVVVDKFQSTSQFDAAYGNWDVGGGLAAMLTTALQQSGQFVVLERASLPAVLFEQQLKAGGAVNPETGPALGQVAAAQFVVIGAVTEFGVQDKGGSFNIGIGGNVKGNPLSSLFGTKHTEGSVAIDMRIVDTSTTQVVQTVTVKEPISQTSFNASVDYKAMNMGGDEFDNTPLGEAARKVIARAVAEIVATAAREPWHGLLVDYDGKEAAINAGMNAGIKPGDHFTVERIAQKLTDPATGEILSVRRVVLGTLQVTRVEEKVSFATFATQDGNQPARGDLVMAPQ